MSTSPCGGVSSSTSSSLAATSSSRSTPNARHMRRSVPNWLIRSGSREPLTFSNSSAGPTGLHDAVGDLGDLELGIDLGGDADELALALEERDPLAEVGRGGGHRASVYGASQAPRRERGVPDAPVLAESADLERRSPRSTFMSAAPRRSGRHARSRAARKSSTGSASRAALPAIRRGVDPGARNARTIARAPLRLRHRRRRLGNPSSATGRPCERRSPSLMHASRLSEPCLRPRGCSGRTGSRRDPQLPSAARLLRQHSRARSRRPRVAYAEIARLSASRSSDFGLGLLRDLLNGLEARSRRVASGG